MLLRQTRLLLLGWGRENWLFESTLNVPIVAFLFSLCLALVLLHAKCGQDYGQNCCKLIPLLEPWNPLPQI